MIRKKTDTFGGSNISSFAEPVSAVKAVEKMPIDVYDTAAWMAITYLSEKSLAMGGAPVEIPDFTSGAYKTREPRDVIELPVVEQ